MIFTGFTETSFTCGIIKEAVNTAGMSIVFKTGIINETQKPLRERENDEAEGNFW